MNESVYLHSLDPLASDPHGRELTAGVVPGDGQPPRGPTAALPGRSGLPSSVMPADRVNLFIRRCHARGTWPVEGRMKKAQ